MIKILTVIGARPQFIKAAALSREFKKNAEISEIIVHTGQHFDANMSDIFFEQMDIPKPDYLLGIHGLNHGAMTGQMLEKIEEVLLIEKPDWVLVYGDTNSTLAGALSAKKLHIKVAHVEAGLRSFHMQMPEEINRILTDRISDILFCPTQTAIDNLKKEGFEHFDNRMILTGDVMQDAALFYTSKMQKPAFDVPEKYVLATIHRAENTDDLKRLSGILSAMRTIAETTSVVLPIHPRTSSIIKKNELDTGRILLIEPVGYLEMVYLLEHCQMVMTDSGGLQKEAFFFSKPCITLRDQTEWVELCDHNFNVLTGTDSSKIIDTFRHHRFAENFDLNLYGRGEACRNIVNQLSK